MPRPTVRVHEGATTATLDSLLDQAHAPAHVIVIAITAPPCPNGHGSNGMAATGSAAPLPLPVVESGEQTLQAPPESTLTSRQLRILSLMAKGFTNGQIARMLAFSESTIRQDTMKIYRTLEVRGRAEAIDLGRANGLIPSTP